MDIKNTLYDFLGKFYFYKHINAPPSFLQIVGWTKGAENPNIKRVNVYVRKVPLIISNGLNGGSWEFDKNIINEYSKNITNPIFTNKKGLVDGNAIFLNNGMEIKYKGNIIPLLE